MRRVQEIQHAVSGSFWPLLTKASPRVRGWSVQEGTEAEWAPTYGWWALVHKQGGKEKNNTNKKEGKDNICIALKKMWQTKEDQCFETEYWLLHLADCLKLDEAWRRTNKHDHLPIFPPFLPSFLPPPSLSHSVYAAYISFVKWNYDQSLCGYILCVS